MKTAAATRETDGDDSWEGLTVLQTDRTEPLSECVRQAIRFYLANLDGYDISGLHEMVLTEVERPLIETVLDYTQGNQTQAARMLGMSRSTLRKKIAHYRIGAAA
jgi:Fis family transcriptional regulator, factor for inversion stimulation protein